MFLDCVLDGRGTGSPAKVLDDIHGLKVLLEELTRDMFGKDISRILNAGDLRQSKIFCS